MFRNKCIKYWGVIVVMVLGWLPSASAQLSADQSQNIQRLAGGILSDWENYLNIVGLSSFESEYTNLDISIFEDPAIPCIKPDFYESNNMDLDRNPLTVSEYFKASKTRLGFFEVKLSNQVVSPVYLTEEDQLLKVKIDYDKAISYELNGKKGNLPGTKQTIFFTVDPQNFNHVRIKGIRYFDAGLRIKPITILPAGSTPANQNEPPAISRPLPEVPLGKLTVTRPIKGQVLKTQRSYGLAWQKSLPGVVNLELYRGASLIQTIQFDEQNSTYNWKVPQTLRPSKEYFIRVFYPTNPLETATSEVFQVKKNFRPLKWGLITVGTGGLIGAIMLLTGGDKPPASTNTGPLPPFPGPG